MRRQLMKLLAVIGLLAVVIAVPAASGAGQMIDITAATVGPDRHVTVDWTGPPNGIEFGALEVATKPDRGTDAHFFEENVVVFDLLDRGQQHYVSSEALQGPGTYYVAVRGWWDGYGPDDYENYGVVYSQVVTMTAEPICVTVVVTPGHWTKKLVRKGHWMQKLVRKGHWIKRNGKRAWVKPVYKKVWVKPVYKKVWVKPVTRQDCH
jgi:hypothetical protein